MVSFEKVYYITILFYIHFVDDICVTIDTTRLCDTDFISSVTRVLIKVCIWLCYFLILQRRSLAPSQILKRKQVFGEEDELESRRKQVTIKNLYISLNIVRIRSARSFF